MDFLVSPIIYAFLAAFFVGTGDFLSRFSSMRRAPIYAVIWVMSMGTILLWSILLYQGQTFPQQSWFLWGISFISAAMNVGALVSLYHALMRGPVAIAAPMTSMATVFLTIEWLLVGVMPALTAYIGIGLSLLGAVCVGYFGNKNDIQKLSLRYNMITAGFSLIAAFFFSARLFLMQYFIDDLGAINALFQVRFFGAIIVFCVVIFLCKTGRLSLPKKGDFHFKYDILIPAIQGLIETIGILFLLFASVGDYRVTAPAIFSIFAVITIFWSIILFKEKVSFGRWCGVILILVGVVIMEMTSHSA